MSSKSRKGEKTEKKTYFLRGMLGDEISTGANTPGTVASTIDTSTKTSASVSGAGASTTMSVGEQIVKAQERLALAQAAKQERDLQELLAQCQSIEAENNQPLVVPPSSSSIAVQQQQQQQQAMHQSLPGNPLPLSQPQQQQQQQQQSQYPSLPAQFHHHAPSVGHGTMAAAQGLVSLANGATYVGGIMSTTIPAAASSHHPQRHQHAAVNAQTLRQLQDLQNGVDETMRRNGLQGGDPQFSSDDSDSDDEHGHRCRRRRGVNKKKSGKWRKMTSFVLVTERWPHTYLRGKYVGADKKYENWI